MHTSYRSEWHILKVPFLFVPPPLSAVRNAYWKSFNQSCCPFFKCRAGLCYILNEGSFIEIYCLLPVLVNIYWPNGPPRSIKCHYNQANIVKVPHAFMRVLTRAVWHILFFGREGVGEVKDITITVIREQIKHALYVQRILFVLTLYGIIKENCPKVPK
jgi:hypothetical protein